MLALVDCNNFYASCERLFEPKLRNRPVVVLSNNDGCVIARSNEAKALGIEMGAPWHLHRKQFEDNDVVVRSSNYTLYGDLSARVMAVLSRFTPDLEIYSIDEAFLELSGTPAELEATALDIRQTVLQWTGIPVSIGVAPTKVLCKVANRLAKKDAAQHAGANPIRLLIDNTSQEDALSRLQLGELWGVARRMTARFQADGISTVLDLRHADPGWLGERFGVVTQRLALELRGERCLSLELSTPDRKSIVSSRSFGTPVLTKPELQEAVTTFTSRAAVKLRRQNLAASSVTAFVETNPFRAQDRQYSGGRSVSLAVASADTGRLVSAAQLALNAVWRDGYRYKKAGVMLLNLVKATQVGNGLFDRADNAASLSRMRAIDALNARYGRDTIAFGRTRRRRDWHLRSNMLSPSYTTDWEDILEV